jgi:membrane fusion protein, multidrug efflux system
MKKTLILLLLFVMGACGKKPPPPSKIVSVSTTDAITCTVPLYYDYVGHVVAYNIVQIVPQVQGFLTNIYFEQGQEVKEGDLLCTIDVRPYRAALAQAEATLAQTVAALKYSEDTVERYAKLVQDDFVSQLDFDNYVTSVLSNEAIIKQNLAEIETARLNLEFCYLKAPMDAVTGVLDIDEGNFIPAGSPNPIVTLNQIQPIYVQFYAPEDDLPKIRKAQAKKPLLSRIYLEGEKDDYHDGDLTLINNQVDQSTGSILLEATLLNEDKALWPGQFSSVRLFLGEIENAVVIPSQAIQIGQNGPYVYVVKSDLTVELRLIKKGEVVGDYSVVNSGLAVGEKVVLEGQVNLMPGAKVSLDNVQTTQPTFDSGLKPP